MNRIVKGWTLMALALGFLGFAEAVLAHQQPNKARVPARLRSLPLGAVQNLDALDEADQESALEEAASDGTLEALEDEGADPSTDEAPEPLDEQGTQEPETEIVKERYPNGAVRIEREVTQDAQGNYLNHGVWKTWDQQGNPIGHGQFHYGRRTGSWIRWFRGAKDAPLFSTAPYSQFTAPFASQATFRDDVLTGDWTIVDAKNRKISQWQFKDGERQGLSLWWHANGRKAREVRYENGQIEGELREWAPDGSLVLRETYHAGRKLSPKVTYHKDGKTKKSEGTYLFAAQVEQTPDDWWQCKLQTTTKQGHDEKHGPWATWYANGQRQQQGKYDHDLQVGTFTWWHPNGQKSLEGHYGDGRQQGTWTWWYESGQKAIQGQYDHGNPAGRWTWWQEDGRVAQSADLSHSDGVAVDMPPGRMPSLVPQIRQAQPRGKVSR